MHSKWYECTGHPVDFYKIILILVLVLLALYFLLNVYNLFWLLFPSLTRLGRIMEVNKTNETQIEGKAPTPQKIRTVDGWGSRVLKFLVKIQCHV